ncbi:hypothetical protein TWF192_005745 [Orbilia oligospora]|uniref:Uncharacterized protein n=1 Tax=Orbilia oligospora TaxID=2813651 RepID=A0A6G1MMR2_ORBOL|nr:hypothetical protein TWF191_003895 [Orbilia oligospora]KAF3263464.1 hypothetical protein TWF192_005745 [Orbilia oligospora]
MSPNENIAFQRENHESESETSTIVEFDHNSICTDPDCLISGKGEGAQPQNDSRLLPISSSPFPPLAPPPTPPLAPSSLLSPSVRAPDESKLLASQLVRKPPYRSRSQRSSTTAGDSAATGSTGGGIKAGAVFKKSKKSKKRNGRKAR